MAALLNSLQMGFRTLAIQKRSGRSGRCSARSRPSLSGSATCSAPPQQRLEQANSELDKLVGVRTRAIQRRLAQVSALPDSAAAALLEEGEAPSGEPL